LPSRSSLFPYTTLFRSDAHGLEVGACLLDGHWGFVLVGGLGAAGVVVTHALSFCASMLRFLVTHYSSAPHGLAQARCATLLRMRSEEHTSELQSRFDLV